MFNPITFNCDLDLEFAWLSKVFAHPHTELYILLKCNENPSWGGGDIEHTRKFKTKFKDM